MLLDQLAVLAIFSSGLAYSVQVGLSTQVPKAEEQRKGEREDEMRLVGLTGGIASGKSTVSRHLESQGLPVVDADKVARVSTLLILASFLSSMQRILCAFF